MRRATVGILLALLVVAAPITGPITLAGATGAPADEDGNGDGDALPERWANTVGGDGDDKLATGVKTDDGYLVVGWSNSETGDDEHDGYVAMLDRTGEKKWAKSFGGPGTDRIYDVRQVEGGYLVAGTTADSTDGTTDGWVMKLGPGGEKQWERTYGSNGPDEFWSLAKSGDAIYLGGFQKDGGYARAWAMELGASGEERWSETYDTLRSGSNEYVNSIFVTGGGELLMTGTITGGSSDPSDAWVLKVDGGGDKKWAQSYGGGEYDRVHDAVATSDGGYVLAGQTASKGNGEKDGWMLKIRADGDKQWERTFGTKRMDAFFGIHDDPDGGYVVSGTKHVLGQEGADGWVVKTDGAGHKQWGETYGGEYWDKFWPVIEGHGSGYLAIGESTSYNDNRDGFVVRLGGPSVAAIQDGNRTETGVRVPLADSPVRAVTLSDSNVSGVLAVAESANVSALSPPGDALYAVTMDGPELAENASATVEFEVRIDVVEDELSDLRVARQTDSGWSLLETTVVSQNNGTAVLSAETDTGATLAVTSVPAPTASIDATKVVTVGESVELSAGSSSAEDGTLTAYEWTVGEETASGQTASLTFEKPGERTVELTVTDQHGLRDTANATVVVNDKPEVSVSTPDGATVGKAASLSADVSDEVGDVTVTWQFDGATVTGKSVEHSFGSPGTKTVTVVVEDEFGAKMTKEVEVDVQASGQSDGQATTTGTNEESGNGGPVPGFGVGIALVALLGAALLARSLGE